MLLILLNHNDFKTLYMELSKALLGALLLGIAVETTSCTKDESKNVKPNTTEQTNSSENITPANCPACGMG